MDNPLCEITVSVVDVEGQPLEGAKVQAKSLKPDLATASGIVISKATIEKTTDAAGLTTISIPRDVISGPGTTFASRSAPDYRITVRDATTDEIIWQREIQAPLDETAVLGQIDARC